MESLDAAYASHRPVISPEEAAALALSMWGWEGRAHERPSDRDRVFEIERSDADRAYLKISNALESESLLETQIDALAALDATDTGFCFPNSIAPLSGPALQRTPIGEDSCFVRLLARVPGVPLTEIHPVGPRLRERIGQLIGSVDRILVAVPASDRPMVWDLRGAARLIAEHLDRIETEHGGHIEAERRDRIEPRRRRRLLESVLARYEAWVEPRAADLRESLIYNDANPANLYVEPVRAGEPRLVGLVDFGDAVRSWTIADLAVACAYAGLGLRDPVSAYGDVAAGYRTRFDITETEADVVFELARLRLALSVTVSSVRAAQDPGHEYLLVSQDAAWESLEQLDSIPPDLARYRLRAACGFPPCPDTGRVVAALEAIAETSAPILDPDPRTEALLMLDLSVETGDDGGTFDPTNHDAFSRRAFGQMHDAGASIGVGRYDEVRWWYTTDAFRSPGNDVDEWRTVHLGVDLFAPPGTPVLTPLAGRVASVNDNDERLDYGPTVIIEHEIEAGDGPVVFRTLYGHLTPETLVSTRVGQRLEAGDAIGAIGAPPGNGDWAPHLHFQIFLDPLDYEGTFPGVAAPSQREVWLALSPDPDLLLRLPAETAAPRPRPVAELLADRKSRLGPSLSLSYRRPLHIVRGHAARLFDAEGQPYLDCVNNVAHVGHAHPRLRDAACRQMGMLNTNTRYLHETILTYTERLSALFPAPLEVCFLVCSGTEANELALRMARTHTGKVGAVVLGGAYHGNSSSVVNLSPYKFNGLGGNGVRPWVRVAAMPDAYRGLYRGPEAEVAPQYAAEVGAAAEALETEPTWFGDRPPGAAAFFHESLLGCGGQIPLPAGYLAAAYEGARAHGAVCVADEVQVGFGRVGSHFWGFEEHGVVPDIVTLGKPIGNGHPLGAVLTTREIAESFADGMEYFNTFGGNPVSCAIGLAVLDVIEEEGLQDHADRVGARLLAGLSELKERHAAIGDVRGRGLFLGIECVRDHENREPDAAIAEGVVERMRERSILLSTDGPDHNVIKFKPPMVFSEADGDLLLSRLDEVLSESAFLG